LKIIELDFPCWNQKIIGVLFCSPGIKARVSVAMGLQLIARVMGLGLFGLALFIAIISTICMGSLESDEVLIMRTF
jgi:hypothetical protein